jgi:hypothetical protein
LLGLPMQCFFTNLFGVCQLFMVDVAYFLKMVSRFGKNTELSSNDIEGIL